MGATTQHKKLTVNQFYLTYISEKTESADELYKYRESEIDRLRSKREISVDDVISLDRVGQFVIAQNYFCACSESAKEFLLNSRPHTASAARNSLRRSNEG